MNTRNVHTPFAAWSRPARAMFAFAAVAGTSVLFGQGAASTTGNEEPTKLEAFSVTGSRIKRIDSETPQPVVRITESDFRASGFSTLGDAIRAMPAISGQSLVAADSGTSFTPGVSSFNLRGLGNNNTLVLVNGRRAAPYASVAFNGFQTVFDFNSIPVAAIESLEVLKDGASAIYGSDAVAGVVNINLKRNYTGLTTELSYGNTVGTDSSEKSFFAIFGAQAGKVSIVATFDYSERASIYGRDLDSTDTTNGAPFGGLDQSSTITPIAGVRGVAGLAQFPNGRASFNTPQTNPTLANAANITPLWNFQELAGLTPDTRTFGFYTRATFEFTSELSGFLETSFRRSQTLIDAAPTPYQATSEVGTSPTGLGNFPAHNPFNPFGQDIRDIRWRMVELGNRIQDITADSPRLVAGLEGSLPKEGWSWNGALLYSRNNVNQVQRGYSADNLVQNAFNGVVLDGVTRYANPFGPNDPAIINYLRISQPQADKFEVRSADISASGPVFTLPAGDVGLALGAEVRTERLENIGTLLNRDGLQVGGGQGSDTFGDRRLYSYYAELSVPVFKNDMAGSLELQAAVRHESYNDFGETTKPKFAAVWRPLPEMLLRASYGESFLAPNLAFLYTSTSASFTSNTLADPLRPNDPRSQIKAIGGGNPKLQPEETEVIYAGLVIQPFARQKDSIFRELSIGVDYFKFEQTNLLNRLTANTILGTNHVQYANLVKRAPPAAGETVGVIEFVSVAWQNLSQGYYEGYDMNLRWVLPKTEYGRFSIDLSGTYIHDNWATLATGAVVDLDGEYSTPQFRGSSTLGWSRGDWAANLNTTYIGEYLDNFGIARVGAQWVVSPQMIYRGWKNSSITVGVRNILNDEAPLDLSDSKLVNENTNYVEPAFWYVRWSRDW